MRTYVSSDADRKQMAQPASIKSTPTNRLCCTGGTTLDHEAHRRVPGDEGALPLDREAADALGENTRPDGRRDQAEPSQATPRGGQERSRATRPVGTRTATTPGRARTASKTTS